MTTDARVRDVEPSEQAQFVEFEALSANSQIREPAMATFAALTALGIDPATPLANIVALTEGDFVVRLGSDRTLGELPYLEWPHGRWPVVVRAALRAASTGEDG